MIFDFCEDSWVEIVEFLWEEAKNQLELSGYISEKDVDGFFSWEKNFLSGIQFIGNTVLDADDDGVEEVVG